MKKQKTQHRELTHAYTRADGEMLLVVSTIGARGWADKWDVYCGNAKSITKQKTEVMGSLSGDLELMFENDATETCLVLAGPIGGATRTRQPFIAYRDPAEAAALYQLPANNERWLKLLATRKVEYLERLDDEDIIDIVQKHGDFDKLNIDIVSRPPLPLRPR